MRRRTGRMPKGKRGGGKAKAKKKKWLLYGFYVKKHIT